MSAAYPGEKSIFSRNRFAAASGMDYCNGGFHFPSAGFEMRFRQKVGVVSVRQGKIPKLFRRYIIYWTGVIRQ